MNLEHIKSEIFASSAGRLASECLSQSPRGILYTVLKGIENKAEQGHSYYLSTSLYTAKDSVEKVREELERRGFQASIITVGDYYSLETQWNTKQEIKA